MEMVMGDTTKVIDEEEVVIAMMEEAMNIPENEDIAVMMKI